ncbi:MAG: hypothetical protein IKN64_02845 [Desulfovibrio sp.]|nr:hypothetical protein [Desulfovibrio sp.]
MPRELEKCQGIFLLVYLLVHGLVGKGKIGSIKAFPVTVWLTPPPPLHFFMLHYIPLKTRKAAS